MAVLRKTHGSGGLEEVVVEADEDDPEAGPVEVEREVVVEGEVELREELGPGRVRAEDESRPYVDGIELRVRCWVWRTYQRMAGTKII